MSFSSSFGLRIGAGWGAGALSALFEGGDNGAADQLRDLRDDGVSQCIKAVCMGGNPINNSEKTGSNFVVVFCGSPRCRAIQLPSPYEPPPLNLCPLPFVPSQARGVGNKPETVARVRGTNGGSWYAVPERIVPERGQAPENSIKATAQERFDVFQHNPIGEKLANETGEFEPKGGSISMNADPDAGFADVLARESAADNVDPDPIGHKSSCCKGSDVIVTRNLGPVFREDAAAERFDFAERDGPEAARALKTEREAADAGKEIKHAQHQSA